MKTIRKVVYDSYIVDATTEEDKKLLIACLRGDLEQVKQLIKNGVDVTFYNEEFSSLAGAIKKGHIEIVKYLLKKGASLKAPQITLCDALDNDEMMEVLLEHALEEQILDWEDEKGKTVLWRAVELNKVELVKRLLEMGAIVDIRVKTEKMHFTDSSTHFFEHVFECGSLDILKVLVENWDIIYSRIGNQSLLETACIHQRYDMALYLIEQGCEIITADNYSPMNLNYSPILNLNYRNKGAQKVLVTILHQNPECLDLVHPNFLGELFTPLRFSLEELEIDLVWLYMLSGAAKEDFTNQRYQIKADDEQFLTIQAALENHWTPMSHKWYPKEVKEAIFCLLLVAKRLNWPFDGSILKHIIYFVPFGWFLAKHPPIKKREDESPIQSSSKRPRLENNTKEYV